MCKRPSGTTQRWMSTTLVDLVAGSGPESEDRDEREPSQSRIEESMSSGVCRGSVLCCWWPHDREPRDPVRLDTRGGHRLPGLRGRSVGSRLRLGLDLEHRGHVGGAGHRALPAAPGELCARHHVRQARKRVVRPGPPRRVPGDRTLDGRHHRRDGHGGFVARGALRLRVWRLDGDALRGHPPRAGGGRWFFSTPRRGGWSLRTFPRASPGSSSKSPARPPGVCGGRSTSPPS